TYNINGQIASESLVPWLGTPDIENVDFFVLGFQELDLSTEAYILVDNAKEEEWSRGIEFAIREKGKYVKVASKQLVGMLIMVYVKKEEVDYVSEVAALYVGTGILGMMGNKGATAIRLRYHSSYFTFVNCHLAADTSMVDRRNADFLDI
ncbi:Type II inositol 1,4,5-trisphosphate 5-phosphatase, partial [Rhizophlyctis rosea]